MTRCVQAMRTICLFKTHSPMHTFRLLRWI